MSSQEISLFLVRHGLSNAKSQKPPVRQGPFQPLSDPTGLKQAENVGRELGKYHADVLLTSPLTRASQTAQIMSTASGVPFPPQTVQEIQEIVRPSVIYGIPLDGFPNALYKTALMDSIARHDLDWRIEDQPDVWSLLLSSLKKAGLNHTPVNRSESWRDLWERSILVRNWLVEEFQGKKVAMVSHSNFVAFLLSSMLLREPDPRSIFAKSASLYLKHGGMAIIEYRRGHWTLTRFDHNNKRT